MRIYLTRHGETIWNTEKRMQGWSNSDLTEKGINNAMKLGEALKDINFDAIYCSPAGRALQTANCIVGDRNLDITKMDSLKEMGFGTWEGMYQHDIDQLHPKEKYNFWKEPHNYIPIDGESFDVVINRVLSVLQEIINTPNLENVLVVTHAVIVKAFYYIIKQHELKNFWQDPFIYDTCLSIIEVKDGQANFILEADISHL